MHDERSFEELSIEEMNPSLYGYYPELFDPFIQARCHALDLKEQEPTEDYSWPLAA